MALRCGAESTYAFPLDLIVPDPNSAVRLGNYREEKSDAHRLLHFGAEVIPTNDYKYVRGSHPYLIVSNQYATIPDEMAAKKIFNLERATRAANPKESEWSIYMTPSAALVPISGSQAVADNNGPISKSTLGDCLARISELAGLRYEVDNNRIFIDLKADEQNAQQSVPAYVAQGAPSAEP